jgi:hypothetical protein
MDNIDNRKDLKIQALLEKVSSLVTNYENTIADLRVNITLAEQENQSLVQQIAELSQVDEVAKEDQDASKESD